MVVTPLHYPQAVVLYLLTKKRISFTSILVGSFLPDTEVPLLGILCSLELIDVDRLFLHSLLGSLTLGIAIGFLIHKLYIYILRKLLRIHVVEKHSDREIVLGIALGALGHILLDNLHHSFNPTLWPFINNVRYLVLFGDPYYASEIMHRVMLLLTIMIMLFTWLKARNAKQFVTKILCDPL